MSEVTVGITGEQKAAADVNTAVRNKMHTSVKKYRMKAAIIVALIPILFMSASWLNGWLNTPSSPKVSEIAPEAQVQDAPRVMATQMERLTVAKGECSEELIVPQGVDIKSTIMGNVRQEKMDHKTAEWTLMVDGASLYATRYCGDGQVLYQFTPTP